jgi:hypothetical protein
MFGFLSPMAWKALGVLVFLALVAASAGRFGYRLADGQWQAREAERLAAEQQARAEDLARAQAVATAYEQVAAQLRRVAAVNRVEVSREIVRTEYRCPVPDAGRLLIDAAQSRAASAAAGPGGPVPDPGPAQRD